MTDQTLAQTDTLKKPKAHNDALRMLRMGWRFSRSWAWYKLAGCRRGMPGLVDFVVRNQLFSAMQIPGELAALGEILAKRRPERALEIGTALGGTLLFLTRLASPQATIVSVDLPGGMFGGGYGDGRRSLYYRFARRGQRLHLLRGDSHSRQMLDRVKVAFNGLPLDYLFIDGDHRYEGVKSDFEMYGPLVKKGGLIAFHDIVDGPPNNVGGVPQFWREIKPQFRHEEFVKDRGQGGLGIGVLHVE